MLQNSADVVTKAVVLCKVVVKTLEDGRVSLEKAEANNILQCVVYARHSRLWCAVITHGKRIYLL